MISFEAIDGLIRPQLTAPASDWWQASTAGALDRTRFLAAFSGAGRRLGRLDVPPAEPTALAFAALGLVVAGRAWAEAGRVGLLLSLPGRADPGTMASIVEEVYRTGDLQEKQAVVRALAFLPEPTRFMAIAAEGARSNAMSIVEAITYDNPYASLYFSEDALNQMIMKALFNGLSLSRVVGLQARMNADVIRMARDYGRERRAAGRTISDDLRMLEQGNPAQ